MDRFDGDSGAVGGDPDMMSPISLQSNRIATMALTPRTRASRHMRCRAWLRLSVSSLVYPATSRPRACAVGRPCC